MNNLTSLLGPAVIAAAISGTISVIALLLSLRTTKLIHTERLTFERNQIENKFRSDIALAEKKLELDRALADWKRQTELAEQVLSDFYRARDLFMAARSPGSFPGEGATRPQDDNESKSDAEHLNAIYAPFERLTKNNSFFADLHARRYRFMALFGTEAAQPFDLLRAAHSEIFTATEILLEEENALRLERRSPTAPEYIKEFKATIWRSHASKDIITPMLDTAVATIEKICRTVLEVRPQ
ncbi:hypothetical protein HJC22_05735 [Corallococcus exiguus]|uniref:hypothetical protein n=1 Tax=Corallococcus TaxID=83461 RepID=UPI0011C34AB7|nr:MULTISPECIES: hypothetical protein [Corallococcus]NNC15235.1 hypothetical protein [Corallococcus exiguus]